MLHTDIVSSKLRSDTNFYFNGRKILQK